jgi:hypothetical protein
MVRNCLILVLLLAGLPVRAASFHVDVLGDSVDAMPGDGLCADALGQCSVRAAVIESNASVGIDTITLTAGIHQLGLPGIGEDASQSGDLDVVDDLVVIGAGASSTIIDGGALDRVLDLQPATGRSVTLEGVTLRNGFLPAGSPVMEGGAGIAIGLGVSLELVDVDVVDNHMTMHTGGVAIDNRGCLHGSRVRLIGNSDTAGTGSGFSASGGILTGGIDSCLLLEDCEISDGRGDRSGAIYVTDGASLTLRRCLLSGNEARFSGAIEINTGGEVRLESTTVSGNAGNPGAILNDGGTIVTLINSTVTANHGSIGLPVVGGIQDVHGGFGLTFLANTIVSGNGPGFLADDCSNARSLSGSNIVGVGSGCHYSALPGDQVDADPGLGPLAGNGGFTRTHLPGPNAIDRGDPATCVAPDQRGITRPIDGNGDGTASCDIGAVEFDPDPLFANGFEPS